MSERTTRSIYFHKQATDYMLARNIPLIPENYAVWYEYVVGADRDLVSHIEELNAKRVKFTKAVNEEIFEQFIVKPSKYVDETKKVLHTLLNDILEDIDKQGKNLSVFDEHLKNSVSKLGQIKTASQLQELLTDLALVIKKQVGYNYELYGKFREASVESNRLREELDVALKESMLDELTGIGNRRMFNTCVNDLMEKETPFSIITLDIDHFKSFNDQFGHDVGDQVIRYVVSITKMVVKGRDKLCRVGGEEFSVVLPETDHKGALTVAEQIRKSINSKRLVFPTSKLDVGKVSISLGVSTFVFGDTFKTVVSRADKCLYMSKNNGRNQTTSETKLKTFV